MARAVPRFSRFQLAISFWILFWGNPWVRPRCGLVRPRCGLVRRGFALGVPWVRPLEKPLRARGGFYHNGF